jgi:predicted metal-dependent hydrolase
MNIANQNNYSLSLSNDSSHPYQLVNSKRAKYIRLKLSNRGELSVVVPLGISHKAAHKFVNSKATWVEKHLQDITVAEKPTTIKSIDLKLLDEQWSIEYLYKDGSYVEYEEHGDRSILISGNVDSPELVQKIINQWLKNTAREHFPEMLNELAELHGFHYQGLSVRSQKTRWGSCSSKKNINLNCKLLLMPESVVNYVMIHELCHTIEMNHSDRFWSLVEDCDSEYKEHRKALKVLEKDIVL